MARMILWSAIAAIATIVEASPPSLLFVSTSTSNDFVVAAQKGQLPVKTFSSVENALNAAAEGDGLLVLADDMRPVNPGVPQTNTTVNVSAAEWATIDKLGLNVYIEFPSTLPPSTTTAKVPTAGGGHAPRQAPKAALPVAQTLWERAAVAKAGGLSPQLGYLDLLHPHKHVDYVQLPSDLLPQADVVLGVIAGYDNATFGLPKTSFPLLVSPAEKVLIAATQLSHCRSRRFAPAARWMALAEYIFDFASNSSWSKTEGATSATLWVPTVTASYNRSEPLPGDAELQALQRGVQFYRNARLLPDVSRATELGMLVPSMPDFDLRVREYARMAPPYEARVSGDGQLGIFEGLTSDIDIEGRQPQSNGVRADCVLETSASFAARSIVTANKSDARVAINLLNFGHIHSGFHQPWALGAGQPDAASIHLAQTRPWVVSGDAFGLKAWTTVDHAYTLYYGDDDARGLLGAVATAGLLQSDRWDTTIVTGVLGNLRQTPKNGFAPSSSTFEALVDATTFDPASGWRSRYDSEGGAPNFSPHYESYIWAVYLLGYAQSGFEPLLSRAQTALTTMMENYPSKWIPTANGIAMQRARIILPLAFLVRANDTALHRQWLQTAVDGFLSRQHCEGDWCAYKEELSCPGWGGSTRVPNNDDYGTFEAPLNQENDDPVSDFLYTSNFALLGLHEAAAALQNATIKAEEDKLARYIVRIQARSTEHPELDGAWMRAFDFEKWEAWASDADIGWGAWSVETGWTQSWITTTLGMRLLNTTLWDLGTKMTNIAEEYKAWLPIMFPPDPPPPPPRPCTNPQHCVTPDSSGNVQFTLNTTLEPLCAASDKTSHVLFHGTTCGDGGKFVEWQSMKTLDPRPGVSPANCEWSRDGNPGDVASYFGTSCGVCPTAISIPTTACS